MLDWGRWDTGEGPFLTQSERSGDRLPEVAPGGRAERINFQDEQDRQKNFLTTHVH
jgi:hypothetical protein